MTRTGRGGGSGGRRGRGPHVPTWVLVLLIAGSLGAAGALFALGDRSPSTGKRDTSTAATTDGSSQDELVVPDGDGTTSTRDATNDTRRRGTIGRERLDEGTAGGTSSADGSATASSEADDSDAADDAAASTRLTGVRVALFAAHAGPRSTKTAARVTSIGGIRVPCAVSPRSATSRAGEATLLARTSVALRARGATVDRIDSDAGTAPCAGDRVRRFERSAVTLEVEVVPRSDATASVTPGRRAGPATTAERSRSAALVTALTDGLGASGAPLTTPTVLASRGALDLAGGGSTVLVRLPAAAVASIGAERLAQVLARAVADALAPPAPAAAGTSTTRD